ncbi:MAG: HAD-IB family hydrolase [Acidimicrobiia bacterium]|jgi:putative phosphoserine phosphatase/1-acylglycerol-3-phosphate O-acyltransferase|nr:HAD-IB family hydrolase [Acidimicrobiia bacterium]
MTGAAFFDLDRTLLARASGEAFSNAMRIAGMAPRRVPGEGLLYRLFNTVGETLPSMALARQAVVWAKGKPRDSVVKVAEAAADELFAQVQPFAHLVIAEHKNHGRPVVLATTSPYDLVKPFADRLGLDDVIATKYGVNDDGTYDGSLVGSFVWSAGKLTAVREWADAHDIDLAESYAYSDSVYDSPLLGAVGNPMVVNPDPRMVFMAAARRWPVINLDVAKGVRKVPFLGIELQKVLLQFARPEMFPYARFDIDGIDNIPAIGAAILVANHRSYFDISALALTVARTGRTVRSLGKKEVFDAPVVGQLAAAMGGIPVNRSSGSEEPLAAAADALAGGELVVLMPEGTIPRGPAFFEPELSGRWGAARLASLTKVPVIPIGVWGTEHVWPRSSRLPNVLNVTSPPLVTVRVGEPVELKYRSANADTKRIMTAISKLLPPEARRRRTPTAEDLARTYPPGYSGDPDAELDRRPGTD